MSRADLAEVPVDRLRVNEARLSHILSLSSKTRELACRRRFAGLEILGEPRSTSPSARAHQARQSELRRAASCDQALQIQ